MFFFDNRFQDKVYWGVVIIYCRGSSGKGADIEFECDIIEGGTF